MILLDILKGPDRPVSHSKSVHTCPVCQTGQTGQGSRCERPMTGLRPDRSACVLHWVPDCTKTAVSVTCHEKRLKLPSAPSFERLGAAQRGRHGGRSGAATHASSSSTHRPPPTSFSARSAGCSTSPLGGSGTRSEPSVGAHARARHGGLRRAMGCGPRASRRDERARCARASARARRVG